MSDQHEITEIVREAICRSVNQHGVREFVDLPMSAGEASRAINAASSGYSGRWPEPSEYPHFCTWCGPWMGDHLEWVITIPVYDMPAGADNELTKALRWAIYDSSVSHKKIYLCDYEVPEDELVEAVGSIWPAAYWDYDPPIADGRDDDSWLVWGWRQDDDEKVWSVSVGVGWAPKVIDAT